MIKNDIFEALDEIHAKECSLCGGKNNQDEILDTSEGFAHRTCLEEQGADFAAEEKINEI